MQDKVGKIQDIEGGMGFEKTGETKLLYRKEMGKKVIRKQGLGKYGILEKDFKHYKTKIRMGANWNFRKIGEMARKILYTKGEIEKKDIWNQGCREIRDTG